MITKEYAVTITETNDQGEDLNSVRFFPKTREGLNDAYNFALTNSTWKIFFQDEEVDSSESFDPNQVDESCYGDRV